MARYAAKGILLKIGDGAGPEVFTTIGQIFNISGPTRRMETLDTTDHDTSGMHRTFIASLKDSGEITIEFHADPDQTTHKKLEDDYSAGTVRNFKLDFSPLGVSKGPATFAALVTQPPEYSMPVDGKFTGRVTLKISGAVSGLTTA